MLDIILIDSIQIDDRAYYDTAYSPNYELDAQFLSVFGRKPDSRDRRLGLRRILGLQQELREFHARHGRAS